MGGVGKTLMAVQLIRDAEVGAAFDRLLWVSVGQDPDPLQCVRMLYFQLKSAPLPSGAMEEERIAVQALREACKGAKVLLVLDDIWDAKHAEMLNCVDAEAGAACLITTRLRNMSPGDGEISCGLLTTEESISLLLTSAGLPELIDEPPAAAYEAVECCGRLALALPMAGGMIRELRDLWETQLVPLLKEELSEEMSTEQRIVNASLRCIEETQRAGVEALFVCFGCFAEDEVVPAAALDAVAPIIYRKAGVTSTSPLRVRKWLASLLRASLLVENPKGMSVHDLVRDVMMMRAEEEEGGMVGLQREILRLFLAAYEENEKGVTSNSELKDFILRTCRHHVMHSQQPDMLLWEDELLMSVLIHQSNDVIASSVKGIGLEELKTAIEECELAGCWWKAAQLWFAASTPRGQRAGRELQRALAAISHVPETGASMALESRSITLLLYVTEGACAWICIAVAACSKSKKVWHAPFRADLEHVDRWLCME